MSSFYDKYYGSKSNYNTQRRNSNRGYQTASRIYQNRNTIRAIYCEEFIPVIKKQVNNKRGLVKGELYALQSMGCDGFMMPEKVYEVHDIVKKYGAYDMNYAVVKQVSGPSSTIFELTRTMCSDLNIAYQDRLQLLPLTLDWKHVEREIEENTSEFNHEDLSTYPTQGGFINYMIVRIGGFSSYRPTHIITSNGKMLNTQDFLRSLSIIYRYDIDGDKDGIELGDSVNFSIITNEIEQIICDNSGHPVSDTRKGYICDAHGDIYIRIDLVGKNIVPDMLKNKSAADILSISWLEEKVQDKNLAEMFTPQHQFLPFDQVPKTEWSEGMVRINIFNGEREMYHDKEWIKFEMK